MTVDFSFFIRRARRLVFLILFAIAWLGAASRVFASQSVELTWAQSSSPNVVYYKVYFGTHSHTYTDSTMFDASTSDVTIPGLANGTTYYFAVTAIDDQNRESAFSNEAVYNVPSSGTLTLQVQGTTAAFRAVDATWTALSDTDISGYAVRCGTQSGVYTNTVVFYGTTEGIIPNLPGGINYFRVFPIDSYGIEPVGSAEVTFVMPAVVPLVLQAHVPTGSSGVELTWNAIPNQGVVGYNLHYGTASHSYLYYQNCGNLTDFILHGLVAGQTYYFAVSPVDAFGNEGQYSSEAICVAPAPFPLAAQVHGSTAAMQAVDISWTASPDPDVNGYVIYYGTGTNAFDGSLFVSGVTDDLLYGLTGGATNYFAVAPVDSFGVEPIASSGLSIFVPAVTNIVLRAQSTNSSKVHLSWNSILNEGIISYNVFYGPQSEAQGGSYEYAGGYGNVNQVDIDGLAPQQTYYFAVIGLDNYGNSTKISNEAMVVTPPSPPMLLQTQTYTDGSGRPYLMEITTPSAVTGPWEVDCSTDMKHWTFYTNGTGYGYGSGYDVDAYVTIDPTAPKMFFRVVN